MDREARDEAYRPLNGPAPSLLTPDGQDRVRTDCRGDHARLTAAKRRHAPGNPWCHDPGNPFRLGHDLVP